MYNRAIRGRDCYLLAKPKDFSPVFLDYTFALPRNSKRFPPYLWQCPDSPLLLLHFTISLYLSRVEGGAALCRVTPLSFFPPETFRKPKSGDRLHQNRDCWPVGLAFRLSPSPPSYTASQTKDKNPPDSEKHSNLFLRTLVF